MATITPAILAGSQEEYKYQIERIANFAERIHIDITDGMFAQNYTIPENQVWWPPEIKADIHMMVSRPSDHLATIIAMNPNMVIFHGECEEELAPIFRKLKEETMIKPAVALLRSTGNLGEMGGRANMMQLEKIRLVKEINPNVEIGWDGGANLSNVFNLVQSGVDVVNVGAAFAQSPEPEQVYKAMVDEINRKGVF